MCLSGDHQQQEQLHSLRYCLSVCQWLLVNRRLASTSTSKERDDHRPTASPLVVVCTPRNPICRVLCAIVANSSSGGEKHWMEG